MEQKENKYKQGKIYMLTSLQIDKIYIGSTCNTLAKRLHHHKSTFNSTKDTLSREILKYDDVKIELIEYFPCNDRNELNKREGELMRQHKDQIVNKKIAGRTQEEYKNDNLEKIKEYKKQYDEHNKEHIYDIKNKDRRSKIICSSCNLEISKGSIYRHNKRKHTNII
jgi:hypothetical protein